MLFTVCNSAEITQQKINNIHTQKPLEPITHNKIWLNAKTPCVAQMKTTIGTKLTLVESFHCVKYRWAFLNKLRTTDDFKMYERYAFIWKLKNRPNIWHSIDMRAPYLVAWKWENVTTKKIDKAQGQWNITLIWW